MNCLHRCRRNASGSATASVLFLLESAIWHQHTTLTNIDSMILITFLRRLTDSEKLKTITTRRSISRFDRVKNSTLSQTDGQTHTQPEYLHFLVFLSKPKRWRKTINCILLSINSYFYSFTTHKGWERKHFCLMDWNSTWRASAAYRRTGPDGTGAQLARKNGLESWKSN